MRLYITEKWCPIQKFCQNLIERFWQPGFYSPKRSTLNCRFRYQHSPYWPSVYFLWTIVGRNLRRWALHKGGYLSFLWFTWFWLGAVMSTVDVECMEKHIFYSTTRMVVNEHLSNSNLVERSSTARGRGRPKKVLHERVLDLTAAVVFPGSRSSYPLISNRTKNVSLAPTMMMMVAMILLLTRIMMIIGWLTTTMMTKTKTKTVGIAL